MTGSVWRIRLSDAAEADFIHILADTREMFGPNQAAIYRATLVNALAAISVAPDTLGSRSRDDILPGLRSLHVARQGRRGRHLILYREQPDHMLEIIRILHDAMDLARHIPTDGE